MFSKGILKQIRYFLAWIGGIGNAPGDSAELKSHKAIITISLYACIANMVYFYFNHLELGISSAYTLLISATYFSLVLLSYSINKNYKVVREFTFFGAYLFIILRHIVMGGFIGSMVYIYYAIPVISGAHILYEKKSHRIGWYLAYMFSGVILFFLEPIIAQDMVPLPDRIILLTTVNNFILIGSLVFLAINHYTNIIKAEKLKSDTLIRNILPKSVVDELNTHGKSSPVMIPSATAIFMDFVGFTRITSQMDPGELVSILNTHFTRFDQIFRKNKVEKLKTIGDGYMAVGGLPDQNKTHPLDVALSAMQVIDYMDKENKGWNVRIGIHTGPMIAGIIGETKFSYDVWGQSVNLSARLETASSPGCINVSHEFMCLTSDFFEFEARGHIEIKNHDPVPMYFLVDLKEDLRSGHLKPNEKFFERYKEYDVTAILKRIPKPATVK